MRKLYLILTCFLLAVPFGGVFAQLFSPDIPVSWRIEGTLADEYPYEVLPEVDVDQLLAEDLDTYHDKSKPFRFAYKHSVQFSLEEHGRWKNLANGDRIWRLGISSAEALAMNVTFDEFFLDKGASVFIYNEDQSEVLGALSAANNRPSRKLGTTHLSGDSITIELYEPHDTRGNNVLRIRSVSHAYRHFDPAQKNFGLSDFCNVDIECIDQENKNAISSSIVLLTIDDGTHWATGTMINNTRNDGRPMFITGYKSLKGTPETWLIYFNYLKEDCSPDSEKSSPLGSSLSGAMLLASSFDKNFALLELHQLPPYEWNIHLAGWDKEVTDLDSYSTIHHPGGDVKKIAQNTSMGFAQGDYYNIGWESGVTEKGSLGAPLFDENYNLVAWMISGNSECGSEGEDIFIRMEKAWNGSAPWNRLKDWLDPGATGRDGAELYFPEDAYDHDGVTDKKLNIFPVPAADHIQFNYSSDAAVRGLRILDLQGRTVLEPASWSKRIDVSGLPRGTYILELNSDKERLHRKFILN